MSKPSSRPETSFAQERLEHTQIAGLHGQPRAAIQPDPKGENRLVCQSRVFSDQEYQALRLNLELQVQGLRLMTQLDLQVFSGFLTIQLGAGGYLAQHGGAFPPSVRTGLGLIDVSLAVLAIAMLALSRKRRTEVVETVRRLNAALRFTEPGCYLAGETVNAPTRFRPWLLWYCIGVVASVCGFLLILAAR